MIACSIGNIDGFCALVTVTVQVKTKEPIDGLRDEIGSEIAFHTNKSRFIDGLSDELNSCGGTVAPTKNPTISPTASPTKQPLSRTSFTFTDDIDFTSTCIEKILTSLVSDFMPDYLGCTGGNSCEFKDITISTNVIGGINCSEGMPCGFALFNVALSYPSSVTEASVRNQISKGFLSLTNSGSYEDALLGRNDGEC